MGETPIKPRIWSWSLISRVAMWDDAPNMAMPPNRAMNMFRKSLGDLSEKAGFTRKSPVTKTAFADEKIVISPVFTKAMERVVPGWGGS